MSKNTNLSFLTDYITADITNGRIGINNPSPTVAFDVVGATKITGVLTLTSTISNGTFAYTLPSATGTLALTSALSSYLPLSGGTLTGALGGTSATFSGALIVNATNTNIQIGATSSATTSDNLRHIFAGIGAFIGQDGAGELNVGNNLYYNGGFLRRVTGYTSNIRFNDGNIYFQTATSAAANSAITWTTALTIASTGAATFSSSVTALSLDVISSNGVGSSTASGLARFITAGTTAGVSIGQSNSGRRLDLLSYGLSITGTDAFITNTGANAIIFENNGSERMRITSGGLFKFQNNGSSYESSTIGVNEFNTNANDTNLVFRNTATSLTAARAGVDVFFANAAPNNTGSSFYSAADNTGTRTLRFEVRSNGGIANYSANNVSLSDIRTKKDIVPIESYWNKFKAIKIVKFKYKDQTHDDFNIGVIAQQVESVAPEFVDVDGWGDTPEDGIPLKSIYTADLYHATIKVLQEAMIKIEELSAKVILLENK